MTERTYSAETAGSKSQPTLWRPDAALCSLNDLIALEPAEGREGNRYGRQVRFQIPLYQRMYVWGSQQIRQLLADVYDAWQRGGNDSYFLGGVLAVERYEDPQVLGLELIDGQQRLTTLWLLALARYRARVDCPGADGYDPVAARLRGFLESTCEGTGSASEPRPRLAFEIRRYANQWARQKLAGQEAADASLEQADEAGDPANEGAWALANLEEALQLIGQWSDDNLKAPLDLDRGAGGDIGTAGSFDEFLLDRVQLLVTRVSPEMDLNHLFEAINDRSVQLEHHEVLKARLLQRLKSVPEEGHADTGESLRESCSRLWDACADMNGYAEANLRELAGQKGSALWEGLAAAIRGQEGVGSIGGNTLVDPESAPSGAWALRQCAPRASDRSEDAVDAWDLASVVESSSAVEEGASDHLDDGNDAPTAAVASGSEVRSVIPFPVLLQHVLRLWLQRNGKEDLPSIDDRRLLANFQEFFIDRLPGDEKDRTRQVRAFFELLWEVRWLFDLHVVKWLHQGDDTAWTLEIRRLEPQQEGQGLQRADEERAGDRSLAMLQSLLYHTQNPAQQLWLTPVLGYLHQNTFGSPGGDLLPPHPSAADNPDALSGFEHFLRRLDDWINCTSSGERSVAQRTRDFLDNPAAATADPDLDPLDGTFGEIPQYWFYKIDFILWLETTGGNNGNRAIPKGMHDVPGGVENVWSRFRLTARSSVEHVQPQNPHDERSQKLWEGERAQNVLHSLGNLALVSRSRNSEFGNRGVPQKRTQYLERVSGGELLSPKLAWIYLYGGAPGRKGANDAFSWTPDDAERHQDAVIAAVASYFGRGPRVSS